ncbi:hypothetical protein B0J14DRAFT_577697 [Halenospora varia]|nr:hypothetical protein B0J14DRAFT_577697 [Halenospora varia]
MPGILDVLRQSIQRLSRKVRSPDGNSVTPNTPIKVPQPIRRDPQASKTNLIRKHHKDKAALQRSRPKVRKVFPKGTSVDRPLPPHRIHHGRRLVGCAKIPGRYLIAFAKKSTLVNNIGARAYKSLGSFDSKMRCTLQIVSTPTADTPGTTLMLHFDQRRYLLGNVAEGSQRATVQRKLGLIKISDIFLTGTVGWGTAGGVLGMLLTVADAAASSREMSQIKLAQQKKKADAQKEKGGNNLQKKKQGDAPGPEGKAWLNIHGGRNLTQLLATARRFIFRKGMPIHTNEFRVRKEGQRKDWQPSWEDELIRVWDMVLEPEGRGISPRKRSHDEFSGQESSGKISKESPEQLEDRYDQMRQAIVSSMFDSDWRLDALVEKPLSEVKLPAAIFVRNSEGKIEKYDGPMPEEGKDVQDVTVLVRNPWPGAMVDKLPPTTPSNTSVCYIIKGHPVRGKFDKNAAIALGVKPGPNFARLTRGESVTTEDGSVVTPEMVLGATKEAGGFAIVELPNSSYVGSLVNREEWSSSEVMAGVEAVVYILGPGVVEDARLQAFMREHNKLKHIVSSSDCCPNYLALESPASAAIRLNLIDPNQFPVPKYSNETTQIVETGSPYEPARPGLTIQLEPKFELQEETIVHHLDTEQVVRDMPEEVLQLAQTAREEIAGSGYQARLDKVQEDIPSRDAEVIALGTGSALPSKYRNVSATLLRVPGYGNYLLDCGENTLGQMKRVFGDELPDVLRDLKAIWISHLHADHHLGTATVIKAWAAETKNNSLTESNKLLVASHDGMINWLKEYSQIEDYGYDRLHTIDIARNQSEKYGKQWRFEHNFEPEKVQHFGITSLKACAVQHCHGAAAVAIDFPNGFKVAYSGDCRPSWDFVEIGKDATLLIHEATFDDELQGDAIAKKHSTTSEALDVGREMNARRILLTHFSQRYQKIPVMDTEEKDQVAIVAFDYMRVKIGDFAKVDAFKPALMKLYEDENGERILT